MNFELIRMNLDSCEKMLQSGNHKEAMRTAYEVAKMMMNYAGKIIDINKDEDLIDRNIALLSNAGAIQSQLSVINSRLSGKTVLEGIRKRTEDVLNAFNDTETEISDTIKANEELISEEDALKKKKKELVETKKKVAELLNLKNNEIKNIENDISKINDKISKKEQEIDQLQQEKNEVIEQLNELETTLQKYIKENKLASKEIEENILTIKAFPNSTSFESVDKLLADVKERLNNIPDENEIRKVITEIQNIYVSLTDK